MAFLFLYSLSITLLLQNINFLKVKIVILFFNVHTLHISYVCFGILLIFFYVGTVIFKRCANIDEKWDYQIILIIIWNYLYWLFLKLLFQYINSLINEKNNRLTHIFFNVHKLHIRMSFLMCYWFLVQNCQRLLSRRVWILMNSKIVKFSFKNISAGSLHNV